MLCGRWFVLDLYWTYCDRFDQKSLGVSMTNVLDDLISLDSLVTKCLPSELRELDPDFYLYIPNLRRFG